MKRIAVFFACLLSCAALAQVPIYTRPPLGGSSGGGGSPIAGNPITCGDGTTATCTIASNLSGATDPSIVFSNDLTTMGNVTGLNFRATVNGATGGFFATISGQNPVGFARNSTVPGFSLYDNAAASPSDTNAPWLFSSGNLIGASAGRISWSSSNVTQPVDAGISRNAAGVVEVNSGTAGTLRDIRARQYQTSQTTVPTCSTNCGTSPTVVGSDSAGIITMGATGAPASGFVLTFNVGFGSKVPCFVFPALATMAVGKMAISAEVNAGGTTMTVTTNGTAPGNSDQYSYWCIKNS